MAGRAGGIERDVGICINRQAAAIYMCREYGVDIGDTVAEDPETTAWFQADILSEVGDMKRWMVELGMHEAPGVLEDLRRLATTPPSALAPGASGDPVPPPDGVQGPRRPPLHHL